MLITKTQRANLVRNGLISKKAGFESGDTPDHKPVVKVFAPWSNAKWLITEIIPDDDDDEVIAFGLCDMGVGHPEMGYIPLSELEALRGPYGFKLERDRHFTPEKSLSKYANEARQRGHITA